MKIVEFIDALTQYSFLQKALLTSVMVGIICGVIGCFIILRGMALMGDVISHAVLPGVALGSRPTSINLRHIFIQNAVFP
ncbi:metal ABC transporter permease, partial [Bacillus toyonensis]